MVKPRPARKTVKFVDEYCETYRNFFPEVRSFDYFKYLHLGMISDIKRKTNPCNSQSSRIRRWRRIRSLFNRFTLVSRVRKNKETKVNFKSY